MRRPPNSRRRFFSMRGNLAYENLGRRRHRCEGQEDKDFRAFVGLALEIDAAAMQGDDVAHQREADAAPGTARAAVIAFENAADFLAADAGAREPTACTRERSHVGRIER